MERMLLHSRNKGLYCNCHLKGKTLPTSGDLPERCLWCPSFNGVHLLIWMQQRGREITMSMSEHLQGIGGSQGRAFFCPETAELSSVAGS